MGNGTSIGRVRGLGPAHHGTDHWLKQRFTAISNLVLMLFLFGSFVFLPSFDYATVRAWISGPLPATAMALLIMSTFYHARLGLQVLVEDYVHEPGSKFACLALLNLAAIGGGVFALVNIARLAFAGVL